MLSVKKKYLELHVTYKRSTSAPGYWLLYTVFNFLVRLSISSSSSFLHSDNPSRVENQQYAHMLMALIILRPFNFDPSTRLTRLQYAV